ncbi:pantoate--beta-alanine ligase [Alteraurantiacibacter palmitatis]|uniref:Pantothenate synthetase n=1 Tax=Alteraurantiacibacter palmitatis TaxID=2054628 RepID=A0ABV7E1V0_9SPHN
MQTVNSLNTLKQAVEDLRQSGRIALVPTMGALHEGHLALVRRARELADHVVVSIFVNPTQFGPNEDLGRYPRRLAADEALLEAEGAALIWAPQAAEMYPQGFATSVEVGGVSEGYCGAARPGHFAGVATVVLKLFNQVQPDFAVFGEKDWQQLAVIRRMAQDLNLTSPCVENIVGAPIVREEDGLALSSRNAYLSAAERRVAGRLNGLMRQAIAQIEGGGEVSAVLADLDTALLAAGFASVDYAALADAESLAPLAALTGSPARLLVAARIGGTRLIDNMPVGSNARC